MLEKVFLDEDLIATGRINFASNGFYFEPKFSIKGAFSFMFAKSCFFHFKGYSRRWHNYFSLRKYGVFIKLIVSLYLVFDYIILGHTWRKKFRKDSRRI